MAVGLIPLVLAACLAPFADAGPWRAGDLWLFDQVVLREAGRKPQVVLVETDPAFATMGDKGPPALASAAAAAGVRRLAMVAPRAQGPLIGKVAVGLPAIRRAGSGWRLARSPPPGLRVGALLIATPESGHYRTQLGWVGKGRSRLPVFESVAAGRMPRTRAYFVRLAPRQNQPRITASQLLSGEIDRTALRSTILLLVPEPPPAPRPGLRGEGAAAIGWAEWSAAAIQTLADGREVSRIPPHYAALMLVAVALLLALVYVRYDAKRIVFPALGLGVSATLGAGYSALQGLNLLLPLTAMIGLQLLAAPLALYRTEREEDRRLRRFVTAAVHRSSRDTLMKDMARLPDFLVASAASLGITRMLLIEHSGGGRLALLGARDSTLDDLTTDRRRLSSALDRAEASARPLDAGLLVPPWPGETRIAALGGEDRAVFWLYALPAEPDTPLAAGTAAQLAASYRHLRHLREELSAGSDRRRRYHPVDDWAGGAVELTADRSDQLGAGLDELDTAVLVFHQIGFPLHANARMAELYDLAGLSLASSTLAEAIAALAEIDEARIAALLRDLTLHGGEARIACREFDTRSRILRIAAPIGHGTDRPRTTVLEAIDITELRRLAELNLSVAHFLDSQLRNDLEAIALAAAIAGDGRLGKDALTRVLGQIDEASRRASGRLEDVALRTRDVRTFAMSEAYPIDAGAVAREAIEGAAPALRELGVDLGVEMPGLSGFTIAEPRALGAMIEAMLRIMAADTPSGETISLAIVEEDTRTIITIAGGIGMTFERMYASLDRTAEGAPAPFRALSRGMAEATRWSAVVSYSTAVGSGYRFIIDLRRIG